MNFIDEITIIFYRTKVVWILNNGTEKCVIDLRLFIIAKNNPDPQRCCPCYNYIFCLRKYFVINKKFGDLISSVLFTW